MARCKAVAKTTKKCCKREAVKGKTRCASHSTKTKSKKPIKCTTKPKRRQRGGGCGCGGEATLPLQAGG